MFPPASVTQFEEQPQFVPAYYTEPPIPFDNTNQQQYQSTQSKRLDKAFAYFSSRMHLINMALALAFSIIELHYGSKYKHQCPINQNIPIFLLVHGSLKIFWVFIGILAFLVAKFLRQYNEVLAIRLMLINLIIQLICFLFFFAWFITGNVWVFSIKPKVQYNPSIPATYCQTNLYHAAFGLIVSTYIVFGIVTLITFKRRGLGKMIRNKIATKDTSANPTITYANNQSYP
ncbi:unnamed protein product [Didymodactylos carnosus]|uniref:MARVEL domain-containing protein n=1 Tax=Didymodactylos carnosus TaxID=1234261 RepID=A0A814S6I3_9BILA|nr:unnamed protein product [Didymodactylos carnosus]CAF3906448.1 unnamed protein product [Didymodactylos carnosus]CAF4128955.1 unnamed protein product [Didymodactylos carnosus]